jgi:hypothetical protein
MFAIAAARQHDNGLSFALVVRPLSASIFQRRKP